MAGFGRTFRNSGEGSRRGGSAKYRDPAIPTKKKEKVSSEVVWREARELIWLHRKRLGIGFLLMAINRFAGFVLPWSSKELIDKVLPSKDPDLLTPLAIIAAVAMLIQAASSFGISQILGVAAQRAITEMRRAVQSHLVRLPITTFDATQTGQLVSRVMSDAEGIRNLVGPGWCSWWVVW